MSGRFFPARVTAISSLVALMIDSFGPSDTNDQPGFELPLTRLSSKNFRPKQSAIRSRAKRMRAGNRMSSIVLRRSETICTRTEEIGMWMSRREGPFTTWIVTSSSQIRRTSKFTTTRGERIFAINSPPARGGRRRTAPRKSIWTSSIQCPSACARVFRGRSDMSDFFVPLTLSTARGNRVSKGRHFVDDPRRACLRPARIETRLLGRSVSWVRRWGISCGRPKLVVASRH